MTHVVAFDLDGTLIDSRQDLAESANVMLASYGAPALPVDVVASMVGDGARQLVERALSAAEVTADVSAALDRFLSVYAERLVRHTTLYPGIEEALAALARLGSLALVTNKPEALSRRLLDAFGIAHYFPYVIGGDSGFPRKPHPAGLGHAIAALGGSPGDAVYVGDSMIDVETARAAGTGMVVAAYGFGHLRHAISLAPGELRASGPAELPDLVAKALRQNPT